MSNSLKLSQTSKNSIKNNVSKKQEKEVIQALDIVREKIQNKFPNLTLEFDKKINLKVIVEHLRKAFPDIDFYYQLESSFISPDGGLLSIVDTSKNKYPILISEVKNQGTNERRMQEGLKKQAKGNAIERLGKNVIGLRTYFFTENIFPFVCFGYGCDFGDDSSILDRVITIGMFGKLNTTYLHNQRNFNRGSFYFRSKKWAVEEMSQIMYDICEKSIYYYFSKYGESTFCKEKTIYLLTEEDKMEALSVINL